jgi:hypothetical protein
MVFAPADGREPVHGAESGSADWYCPRRTANAPPSRQATVIEWNSPVALFPVANLDARLRKMLPDRLGAFEEKSCQPALRALNVERSPMWNLMEPSSSFSPFS